MDFEVCVKNEILGDSKRIMSMEQLMTYNLCALACAFVFGGRLNRLTAVACYTDSQLRRKNATDTW